jgi:hypothetical protein
LQVEFGFENLNNMKNNCDNIHQAYYHSADIENNQLDVLLVKELEH